MLLEFPESFTALWDNRELRPEFSMPPPNDFICTNFEIIAQEMDHSEVPRYPEAVFSSQGCECYYKLDARFKLPHAFIYVYLVSPKTITSIRYMILTSLYSMIVKHYMSEKLYCAVVAGLGYELYSEEKGMLLKLSGYNEKLPLLLDLVTKELKIIGGLMEQSVFQTYQKQYKKYCYNNLINSKFFNKDCRLNIVEEDHKFFHDRYIGADNITFENLVNFAGEFLDQLKIQILVQGNLTKAKALEVGETVLRNLNSREVDHEAKTESRCRKLPVGSNVFYARSMLPNDKNSTTTNFIQLGPSSIQLQCLVEFIEKIMEEPLFDILRTQEQLGYSVSCSHRFNYGILGLSFTVQSQENKNPTTVCDERIETFVKGHMLSVFEKLTDEQFTTIQSSLIKLKNMVDVELESEVNRNWSEITSREYIFNRLELEAQAIAQFTKDQVVDFFKTQVIGEDTRKLSIQIIGNASDSDDTVDDEKHVPKLQILPEHHLLSRSSVIKDFESFTKSLELYPITKTVIDV